MKRLKTILVLLVIFSLKTVSFSFAESIESRFRNKEKLVYKIYYNGVPSGKIEWKYLGKQSIKEGEAEVLLLSSKAKLLKLLNLTSKEKVFLDSKTCLPLRVERNVALFGKKETITEIYDQENGFVTIKKSRSKTSEEKIYQDAPIHNILELLYFFPQGIELKPNGWMEFNLPTQKVRIKMVGERRLRINGKSKDTYLLVGRGAKRFNIWLDKEKRLPLRLEFITITGKITIKRVGKL